MNVSCPECQSVFRVDPARVPGPGIRARCSVCGGIIPITSTRSWTDDFATPHDAASLTTSSSLRAPARPISGGSAAIVDPRAGMASRPTPPIGVPRSPTPARVPPFGVAKRPTPAATAPVAPVAAPTARTVPPAAPPIAAQPQPRPVAPRPEPEIAAPISAAPAAQPPRVGDVPIGAPIAKPAAVTPPVAVPAPRPAADLPPTPSLGAAPPSQARPADAGPAPTGKAPINPFLANDPNQKAKRLARALVSDMVAYHPQKRDEGMRAGTLKQLFREEIKKSYEEYVEQIGKEFAESTSHFQDALNDVLAGGKKVF
jgi:predicted Zn finger-like uncharacterized protein